MTWTQRVDESQPEFSKALEVVGLSWLTTPPLDIGDRASKQAGTKRGIPITASMIKSIWGAGYEGPLGN